MYRLYLSLFFAGEGILRAIPVYSGETIWLYFLKLNKSLIPFHFLNTAISLNQELR